jgi:hypothetical protein
MGEKQSGPFQPSSSTAARGFVFVRKLDEQTCCLSISGASKTGNACRF